MSRLAALLALTMAVPGLASAQTGAGDPFGARDPVACPTLRQSTPPTPEQAALLVRCKRETISGGELWLVENVKVALGAPRAFRDLYNVIAMPEADVTKPVYPIRGGWTWSVCRERRFVADRERNCRESDVIDAVGACWQTKAGAWACAMSGRTQPARQGTSPPR